MPRTTSAIYAAKLKYESLDPSNFPDADRPPLFFDYVPQTDDTGAQLRPPYGVLRDLGQTPTLVGFERTTLEVCQFDLEFYYVNDLGKNAAAIWAVRLNGGGIGDGLGFDYGELPDLDFPRESYQILRGKVRFNFERFDKDGKPVHRGTVSYKVTIKEVP